jgi:outer membrane protein assembly factor BamB
LGGNYSLDLKRKKGLTARIAVFAVILLACALLLTGCVRGMTPIGWSGFTAGNGYLYTGSKEGRLVSVNLSNNSLQYAEPLRISSSGASCYGGSSGGGACGASAPTVAIYGSPVLSTVPVLGDLVYIAGYNGKVFAYDAASLQQRWVYPVDGYLSPIVSTLIISGNTLYFGCTDKNVYALDTATGAKKWQFATGGEIWSSPTVDNNTVFISSFDKKIYAIDAATGEKKWDFPTGANNVAPLFTLDNVVYVGSLDRNLYALDETNGSQLWKYAGGSWFWARPVATGGNIFAPCLDNRVYVLEAKTGKKVAEYNIDGQVASWPVVVNNQVIVATENGKLWDLDAANLNASPRLISSIPENVTCPLAAVNDVIYINGPDNALYAYNIVTGAKFVPVSLSSK